MSRRPHVAAVEAPAALKSLPGRLRLEELDNGLSVCLLANPQAPIVTTTLCYRAVLETITNAEAIGGFQFIPEAEVFAFEHWPLERRKIEEQDARGKSHRREPLVPAEQRGGDGHREEAASEQRRRQPVAEIAQARPRAGAVRLDVALLGERLLDRGWIGHLGGIDGPAPGLDRRRP